MKRQMARAKSFGIEFEFISPAEAGKRAPILRTDDLAGAVWIPGDGKANPTDLTQSLAKGARMRGARSPRASRSPASIAARRARRWRPLEIRRATKERSRARRSSIARGSGRAHSAARRRHRSALRRRALLSRHQGRLPASRPDMPVIRDPDGYPLLQGRKSAGIVMGGFEPKARPWNVDPIPEGFEFQLLPEDWDHFEILMSNAIHRTPCLETGGSEAACSTDPESFTLDGNFILGEAPESRDSSSAPDSTRQESQTPAAPAGSSPSGSSRATRRSTCGTSTSRPFRAVPRQSPSSADRTVESLGSTTRCAGRARSSRPSVRCAGRRSTTDLPRRARCSAAR